MRAAQVKDYGDIDEMLSVQEGLTVPRLADPLPQKGIFGPYGPHVLVKVLSVSLSPGDWRTISGKTRNMQGPPSFPYIPGGDCCGIVVEVPEEKAQELPFKVGDRIAARFTGNGPKGALGEYALVDAALADKAPDDSISSDGLAALASASYAVPLADLIHEGDERVLVLGAGGGLGSHFCQLVRDRGASYVVGVSSSPQRLLEAPLSCDEAIDYTKEDVFATEKFSKDPFDVIIDLSCGGWPRLEQDAKEKLPLIVKPASQGGRYITTLPDKPVFEVSSTLDFVWKFIHPALLRAVWSRTITRNRLPSYSLAVLGPDERVIVTRTMELASEGKLKPVMDTRGPFPFTTEGVRDAFRLQECRHAHGKVIIRVADDVE
jgi:NADPH:quinone reductase-like Zn-dependent oxidoreductase